MGQYYKYLTIDKNNKAFSTESWDFDNGAKLTEHSWIGNKYVNACLNTIYKNPCKVAWIGDYADSSKNLSDKIKKFRPYFKLAWSANDILDNSTPEEIIDFNEENANYFLINHTKQTYLDLAKYIKNSTFTPSWADSSWCINPLPILTACGNGLGGGDYYGSDMKYVGTWAFDEIEFTNEKPENYKEVTFKFVEE